MTTQTPGKGLKRKGCTTSFGSEAGSECFLEGDAQRSQVLNRDIRPSTRQSVLLFIIGVIKTHNVTDSVQSIYIISKHEAGPIFVQQISDEHTFCATAPTV